MRVAVVGSRGFTSRITFNTTLAEVFYDCINRSIPVQVISGGAAGPDTWSEEIAKQYNLEHIVHKPDWELHGKSAGYIRNELIIKDADLVLAYWDGSSKGTKHSIDLAIKQGKLLNIYVRK